MKINTFNKKGNILQKMLIQRQEEKKKSKLIDNLKQDFRVCTFSFIFDSLGKILVEKKNGLHRHINKFVKDFITNTSGHPIQV